MRGAEQAEQVLGHLFPLDDRRVRVRELHGFDVDFTTDQSSRGPTLNLQRSYDLCAGLYEHVNRFPRAWRTLLGRVMLEDALHMMVLLTVAKRRTQKGETLAGASGLLTLSPDVPPPPATGGARPPRS